jgi:hypothetical protein
MLAIRKSVLCLVINAAIGVVLFYFPSQFLIIGYGAFLLSLLSLMLAISHFKDNLLYQFRILFLASVGYFAGFAKIIDADLAFSPIQIDAQSLEIGVKMYGLTSLAILGAFIGLRRTSMNREPFTQVFFEKPMPKYWLFALTFFAVFVIGYLSSRSYGSLVWQGVYASGEGEGQLLGNLQSMGVICTTLLLLAAKRIDKKTYYLLAFIASIYFLVWSILLRGGRLEFLSGIFTIIICLQAANGHIFKINFKNYSVLIICAILMEFWGYLRSSWAADNFETFTEGYVRLFESGVLFAGTLSGIATTFSNTIDMLNKELIEFQLGRSYLDYILRTPPEFIYPDRPKDLSAIFAPQGYASVGGFFEIAEAYINFSLIGVFVIPMLISYIFSKIYNGAIRGSTISFFLLMGISSVFFRGAWYQTFAFYKAMVTAFVIFVIYSIFLFILQKRHNNLLSSHTSQRAMSSYH